MACGNLCLIYDETFPTSSSAVISILLNANHFFPRFNANLSAPDWPVSGTERT
ncbi:MAG: hypothetical protein IKP89_04690 [Bacteroidales bacterium]|nr:hypothetical protein [Bacteroidales bacterium]